jgi:hypothetical protein
MEENKYIPCYNHNSKIAKKFCKACNVFACNGCILENHVEHIQNICKLNKLYTNEREMLDKLITEFGKVDPAALKLKCAKFIFHEASIFCKVCKSFLCEKCSKSHEHECVPLTDYFEMIIDKAEFLQRVSQWGVKVGMEVSLDFSKFEEFDNTFDKIFNIKARLNKAYYVRNVIIDKIKGKIQKFLENGVNRLLSNKKQVGMIMSLNEKIKFEKDKIKVLDHLIEIEKMFSQFITNEEYLRIRRFLNEGESVLKSVYKSVDTYKDKVIKTIENVNKIVGELDKFDINENIKNDIIEKLGISSEEYEEMVRCNVDFEETADIQVYTIDQVEPNEVRKKSTQIELDINIICFELLAEINECKVSLRADSADNKIVDEVIKIPENKFTETEHVEEKIVRSNEVIEEAYKVEIIEEISKHVDFREEKPEPIEIKKEIPNPIEIKENLHPIEIKEEIQKFPEQDRDEDKHKDNKSQFSEKSGEAFSETNSITEEVKESPEVIFQKKIELLKQKISAIESLSDKQELIKGYMSLLTPEEIYKIEMTSIGYNCKSVFIYNPLTEHVSEIEFPHFKFPAFHTFINIRPYIYISGGKEANKDLNVFYKIKRTGEKTFEHIELPSLIVSRSAHTMLSHKNNIYALSGSRVKSCEVFNCDTNSWKLLPDLNSSREKPMACMFDDEYLYVFMGFDKNINKYVNTIERLNINTGDKWEFVNYKGNQNIMKRQASGCYFKDNNIYIIGGVNALRNETREVLVYNFNSNAISLHKQPLSANCSFNQLYFQEIIDDTCLNFSENFEIVKFDHNKYKL